MSAPEGSNHNPAPAANLELTKMNITTPATLAPAKIEETSAVGVLPSYTVRNDHYEYAARPTTHGTYCFQFAATPHALTPIQVHDVSGINNSASWGAKKNVKLAELEKLGRWVSKTKGEVHVTSL